MAERAEIMGMNAAIAENHGETGDDVAGLSAQYAAVRDLSERLAGPLSAEDRAVQSMPDASPTKWHLAHTTWFFETVILSQYADDYAPFDPAFAYLFNSYYEGLGPRHPRPQRGLLSRPSNDEVMKYRSYVDAAMQRLISRGGREITDLVTLGLHHEQQHQELLLTDIKHAFFSNPLMPAYAPMKAPLAEAAPLSWREYPGGIFRVGHEGEGFAFDNEGPAHDVLLRPFRIASRNVTCGEYRAFMEDGGYRRPEFWLSDGWAMAQSQGWDAPLYWISDGEAWSVFTLNGVRQLDLNEPVAHVSFFEAAAYAAWAGARLPTEFEWETAMGARTEPGKVWEWTRSSYDPYPGYKPFDGTLAEYNGKFMSGQMVLRGGSQATPPRHLRHTYRNFFPPSARWQFSGIRLAGEI
ncbi:MAG TPA: ergothioneine biosynthesis protein EgtB [Rhizomicrobium sp.]